MSYGHARPTTLTDALAILADAPERARPIAGGTDVMVMLRAGQVPSSTLLDLSDIGELGGIAITQGMLRIGAGVTYSQLLADPLVTDQAPVLRQAAQQVGSVQIRNLGTIGGNLANASPAGDLIPPLYVLDAVLTLQSASRSRELPIADFFLGVRRTALEPGELLTGIGIPARAEGMADRFFKHGPRDAQAIALVNMAMRARAGEDGLSDVRLALGCVGPTVVRATATEAALAAASPDGIDAAAATLVDEISPIDDLRGSARFRTRMAIAYVGQAAREILGEGS